MAVRATRIAGVAGALLVCAWFVLAAVQARALDRAKEVVRAPGVPSAAQTDRAERLLDTAGFLSPGTEDDLIRAQLLTETARGPEARRLLDDVVAREPDNIDAWSRLAFLTLRKDPRAWAEASAQLRRLAPPVPE
jgi:hypothetical protein